MGGLRNESEADVMITPVEYPTLADYLAAQKLRKQSTEDAVVARLLGDAATITVSYSGSGDSGQIDDVTVCDAGGGKLDLDKEDEELITAYCYDKLDELYGGWENNDGAAGEFVINMLTGNVAWRHTWYEQVGNTEEHAL